MIKEAIKKLMQKENLSSKETEEVFEEIFEGEATPSQIAAFLVSLKIKKETAQEIYGAVKVIRNKAKKVKVRNKFLGREDENEVIFDTCGTGGSGINKFNISTCVAFLISASGVKVAKHGNRAMSSFCGSADVLEELGIKIDMPTWVMEEAIKKIGIGFLYAPLYHPALKSVAGIRKELGVRTIFNILGPLCSPAQATHQLLGVYDKELVLIIAKVLKNLGVRKAFVVHSQDLKDEVSLGGKTFVSFVKGEKIENFVLNPSGFGLKRVKLEKLLVKDVKSSAKLIEEILEGKNKEAKDVVLANASCCFYLLGRVKSLKEGVKLADFLIREGKAKNKLVEFREFIQKYA